MTQNLSSNSAAKGVSETFPAAREFFRALLSIHL
jgi:hypothetical protein